MWRWQQERAFGCVGAGVGFTTGAEGAGLVRAATLLFGAGGVVGAGGSIRRGAGEEAIFGAEGATVTPPGTRKGFCV